MEPMGSRSVPNIVACPNASHGQQLSFSRYTILVGLPVKRSVSRRAEPTFTSAGQQSSDASQNIQTMRPRDDPPLITQRTSKKRKSPPNNSAEQSQQQQPSETQEQPPQQVQQVLPPPRALMHPLHNSIPPDFQHAPADHTRLQIMPIHTPAYPCSSSLSHPLLPPRTERLVQQSEQSKIEGLNAHFESVEISH